VERHLDEERPGGAVNEAVQQVAFADTILVGGCGWWVAVGGGWLWVVGGGWLWAAGDLFYFIRGF
jgi:hypothetical protein